ncbi:Hypothetical_protein [Hexamita inflata]|uniref:Hypothetical_protein n=1 Tax=Hexamita inflata TaxID=28002 RepID=A0AA86Q4D1_9EUKA|nr:Hypothetical protein HINF_LOCUS39501 [Hexamita inflata]
MNFHKLLRQFSLAPLKARVFLYGSRSLVPNILDKQKALALSEYLASEIRQIFLLFLILNQLRGFGSRYRNRVQNIIYFPKLIFIYLSFCCQRFEADFEDKQSKLRQIIKSQNTSGPTIITSTSQQIDIHLSTYKFNKQVSFSKNLFQYQKRQAHQYWGQLLLQTQQSIQSSRITLRSRLVKL